MHASHSYVERYEMDLHNEEIQFRKKKRWEAIGAIKIHVHDIENKIHSGRAGLIVKRRRLLIENIIAM